MILDMTGLLGLRSTPLNVVGVATSSTNAEQPSRSRGVGARRDCVGRHANTFWACTLSTEIGRAVGVDGAALGVASAVVSARTFAAFARRVAVAWTAVSRLSVACVAVSRIVTFLGGGGRLGGNDDGHGRGGGRARGASDAGTRTGAGEARGSVTGAGTLSVRG